MSLLTIDALGVRIMPWLVASLTLVAAYFIGAIPFGYLVARMRDIDIYAHGSGNIGATNIGRVLGHRFGLLVFALDCAKGAIPVALALWLKPNFSDQIWAHGYVEVAAGLTAFLGHLFPVYLRFRGGKGVATGLGAVSVLLPIPALVALAVWSVILVASRYMSLASISAVFVVCAVYFRQPNAWNGWEPRTWFCLIAGTLVLVKHRANIGRLLTGTENKLRNNVMMRQLNKSLHVLALGLWFGSSIFFTFVVATSLFQSFETAAQKDDRDSWFPQPTMYRDVTDAIDAPKEQGSRAAGYAIGPMFLWYFAVQGACGFITLASAMPWFQQGGVHRWRVRLLLLAVVFVLIGWPLEQKVSELRLPRNQSTEAFLQDVSDAAKKDEMVLARGEFLRWHLVSVMLNLATILFLTAAMAMAANWEAPKTEEAGRENAER
jgi:acyl-phosphate glycerol 3-phosphate acyltransferase